MTQTRDIFQAIVDPTRRQIIDMLARKSLNVNAIAREFDITRQAVSLHVQFLNDCGLIAIKQKGRERYCEAKLQKLSETFGGFVALMGDVVVISINHVPTGVASASHTPVAAKRAYHQLLLPGNHISQMQGVTVFCKEDGLPDGVVGM